jgi:hypothetical protein
MSGNVLFDVIEAFLLLFVPGREGRAEFALHILDAGDLSRVVCGESWSF